MIDRNNASNDPRLKSMAQKAGCSSSEMLKRIMKNAGIKTLKKVSVQ